MQRPVVLVIAWFLAGVGAVSLASMAVGAAGDQLTDDRPAPLNAAQVREELAEAAASSSTTVPPSSTPTAVVDDHSTGSDDDDRGGSPTTTPTTTIGTTPTTVAPAAPTSTTKTFTLIGGTATLRFSSAGVTVVTATPKPGYDVEVEPEHGNGVKVEFESDTHRSRVSGWWDGGPRSETREDEDGDSSDSGGDDSSHG